MESLEIITVVLANFNQCSSIWLTLLDQIFVKDLNLPDSIAFIPSWCFLLAIATLLPMVLGQLEALRLPFYKWQSFLEPVLDVDGL